MRTLLTLCQLAVVGIACAQCGMTVTMSVNPVCGNGSISVNTTGGTGPYTIAVETHGFQSTWSLSQTFSSDADGDLSNVTFGFWLDRKDQARVTVTDATTCTATFTTQPWQPTYQQLAQLHPYLDCSTGTSTIELVALDMGSPLPSTWSFTLDNGPLTSFLQGWTLVTGSNPERYRYNGNLTPGAHTVAMPTINSSPYLYCGIYALVTTGLPVSAGDCGVNFRLRAALDGALPSGTIMTDGLRAANLVPAAQPYTALGYTFVGSPTNVSITPAMLAVAGNDAIVDWVVVELRSNTTTVVYSKPALLQRDGDVIDTDGDTYMNFPVTAGSYYVALRHRNHLGVMTSTARSLTVDASSNLIDFRSSASGVYGTTPMALKGSVYCLWAGDATGTGTLSYIGANNDRDPILTAVGGTTPNNSLTNVYDRRDVNLDGVIRYTGTANDRDIILTNVGSTTPNNTRTQQLP